MNFWEVLELIYYLVVILVFIEAVDSQLKTTSVFIQKPLIKRISKN